jgi:hypothetical protein
MGDPVPAGSDVAGTYAAPVASKTRNLPRPSCDTGQYETVTGVDTAGVRTKTESRSGGAPRVHAERMIEDLGRDVSSV